MKKLLLFFQLINIVGITNLITVLFIQDLLGEVVTRFAIAFSSGIVIVSLMVIVLTSVLFFRRIDLETSCSTILSPFYRFLLVNPIISNVLILLSLGITYGPDFFKIAFLSLLVTSYPIFLFCKSSFVANVNGKIRIYSYSNDFEEIGFDRVLSIKMLQMGLLYKITYMSEIETKKARYFFPKGGLLLFKTPDCVRMMRERIRV